MSGHSGTIRSLSNPWRSRPDRGQICTSARLDPTRIPWSTSFYLCVYTVLADGLCFRSTSSIERDRRAGGASAGGAALSGCGGRGSTTGVAGPVADRGYGVRFRVKFCVVVPAPEEAVIVTGKSPRGSLTLGVPDSVWAGGQGQACWEPCRREGGFGVADYGHCEGRHACPDLDGEAVHTRDRRRPIDGERDLGD